MRTTLFIFSIILFFSCAPTSQVDLSNRTNELNEKLEKGLKLGSQIDTLLRGIADKNDWDCLGDIRSLGCMNAVEIVSDRESRAPASELTSEIVKKALSKGLIMVTAGPARNVIRILVPLSANKEIVEEGINILETSIGELL